MHKCIKSASQNQRLKSKPQTNGSLFVWKCEIYKSWAAEDSDGPQVVSVYSVSYYMTSLKPFTSIFEDFEPKYNGSLWELGWELSVRSVDLREKN